MGAMEPKVVIVGAGFGGLNAARRLTRKPVNLVIIDKKNHHLFQPLLYQVATAGLNPSDIAFPIRSIFSRAKNTEVMMTEVTGVDKAGKRVLTSVGPIGYDYLVLATGSEYNYFGHEEWAENAPNLKSIPDAVAIRERILSAFELAEIEPDPLKQRRLMTFVLVGAGPTGVEMAGAIAELAHRALEKDFRRIDPRAARILLLDALPRILTAFPESLADYAMSRLADLGVEVITGARVERVSDQGVIVSGEPIDAHTVIWTAGVKASPAAKWLGVEADKAGRVLVGHDLSVPGNPEIFIIGDAACVFSEKGQPLPGLAPVAIQEGIFVADTILRRAEGGPEDLRFVYRDKGNLATIGRSSAIAEVGKLQLDGFLAWLLWLGVHIIYLIGFRNRALVLFQWAWSYITFQRGARLITLPEGEKSA